MTTYQKNQDFGLSALFAEATPSSSFALYTWALERLNPARPERQSPSEVLRGLPPRTHERASQRAAAQKMLGIDDDVDAVIERIVKAADHIAALGVSAPVGFKDLRWALQGIFNQLAWAAAHVLVAREETQWPGLYPVTTDGALTWGDDPEAQFLELWDSGLGQILLHLCRLSNPITPVLGGHFVDWADSSAHTVASLADKIRADREAAAVAKAEQAALSRIATRERRETPSIDESRAALTALMGADAPRQKPKADLTDKLAALAELMGSANPEARDELATMTAAAAMSQGYSDGYDE